MSSEVKKPTESIDDLTTQLSYLRDLESMQPGKYKEDIQKLEEKIKQIALR
jgi:hypothetical protein